MAVTVVADVAELLEAAYGWLDAAGISLETLLVASIVFLIAMLFASREAASWFLKTHDIKKDVARLEELTLELQGDVRALEVLIRTHLATEPAREVEAPHALPTPFMVPEKNGKRTQFQLQH